MKTLLQLTFFGTFVARRATGEGELTASFRTEKARALLAYLAVERGLPHERATLAGLLWPDGSDDKALRNLSQTLVRLREAIGNDAASPPFFEANRQGVMWNPAAAWQADLIQFDALRASGTAEDLAAAIALYRGDFMAGFGLPDAPEFDTWLLYQRERHRQFALDAMSKLAQLYVAAGKYIDAEATARQYLNLEPWHEPTHRLLMRALALSGQRGDALLQYEACRRVLADELGIEPEADTLSLYEQIRSGMAQPTAPNPSNSQPAGQPHIPQHNLPAQLTPLIGREPELAALKHELGLASHRLITITGLGGVGKTRLALAAAREAVGDFANGVWWVPLVGIGRNEGSSNNPLAASSAEAIAEAIAQAIANGIGMQASGAGALQKQLCDYLSPRALLLVLDNFEHLAHHADFVATLLHAAPQVHVLVTSRARLHLEGERELALTGLPVPERADPAGSDSASVRLFVERATRVEPNFVMTPAHAVEIAHICRLVEGLPLGIELAAGWVQHLSPGEIIRAIQDSLDVLTSTQGASMHGTGHIRQGSMRAVFEQSWHMLSARGQQVLAQLSVFRGAFSRAAAQAVAGAKLLDLALLVNQSLLMTIGPGRYDMHELLRKFAGEHLDQPDPHLRQQTEDRHCQYFFSFVGEQAAGLHGENPQHAMASLLPEMNSIRQACAWAIRHGKLELLHRDISALGLSFSALGFLFEGDRILTDILELAQQAQQAPSTADAAQMTLAARLAAKAMAYQTDYVMQMQDFTRALDMAYATAALAQQAKDVDSEASAHLNWGMSLIRLGELDDARRHLQLGLALVEATSFYHAPVPHRGRPEMRGLFFTFLTFIATLQGNLPAAADYRQRTLDVYTQAHDRRGKGVAMFALGGPYRLMGYFTQARDSQMQALQLMQDMGVSMVADQIKTELGRILSSCGQWREARGYLDAARSAFRLRGDTFRMADAECVFSRVAFEQAAYSEAIALAQNAVAIARQMNHPSLEAHGLHRLGEALLGEQNPAEAALMFEAALTLRQALDVPHRVAETQAGLASARLAQGQLAQAHGLVNDGLNYLSAHSYQNGLGEMDDPMRAYLTCFQVLRACGDPRADGVLASAHILMMAQADKISDAEMRQAFLHNVAAHCEIEAAFTGQVAAL